MHYAVLPLSLYTVVPLHRPVPCFPFRTYGTLHTLLVSAWMTLPPGSISSLALSPSTSRLKLTTMVSERPVYIYKGWREIDRSLIVAGTVRSSIWLKHRVHGLTKKYLWNEWVNAWKTVISPKKVGFSQIIKSLLNLHIQTFELPPSHSSCLYLTYSFFKMFLCLKILFWQPSSVFPVWVRCSPLCCTFWGQWGQTEADLWITIGCPQLELHLSNWREPLVIPSPLGNWSP